MAWFDDLNLPGATISGFFGYVTEDGPDDDDRPDVRLASGTVTFTATTPAARVDGAWLGIRPVTATIFDGEIVVAEEDLRPVRLLATDANIGVADWAWKATFDVKGFRLSELTFKAPRDTIVNLTADLIPIKSQPYQIIEGASIVDTEVDTVGARMRFKMSDGTFTSWVNVPNGEPGAKGDPGGKGDPGKDGQAATLAMGAVSAGTSADAWMTGPPTARELNLVLPRGPKGESGLSPRVIPEGADVSAVREPGLWIVPSTVHAATLTNWPTIRAGSMLVSAVDGQNMTTQAVTAMVSTAAPGEQYFRATLSSNNTSWAPWNNPEWVKGIIPSGTNMDTYRVNGAWGVSSRTGIASLPGSGIGVVEVVSFGSSTGLSSQKFTERIANDDVKVWSRYTLSASGWAGVAWEEQGAGGGGAAWAQGVIPNATDLGTWRNPGVWQITTQTAATSMSGMPTEKDGTTKVLGPATVETMPGTGTLRASQRITVDVGNAGTTFRLFQRSTGVQSQPWPAWQEVGGQGGGSDVPANVRVADVQVSDHATRVEIAASRRGGSIGTSGVPVFMWRFDHWLLTFRDKILPILREFNLPATLNVNYDNMGLEQNGAGSIAWENVQDWNQYDGIEIANHGSTHTNPTTMEAIFHEVVEGRRNLEAAMPRVAVETWHEHGSAYLIAGDLDGDSGLDLGRAVESFTESYAGRLVMAEHAVVEGKFGSFYPPLTGRPQVGQSHYSLDRDTATTAITAIEFAQKVGRGMTGYTHPGLMDGVNIGGSIYAATYNEDGSVDLAYDGVQHYATEQALRDWATTEGHIVHMPVKDFRAICQWLATERDAGRLMVMTAAGGGFADKAGNQRENLLVSPDLSADWSYTAGWSISGKGSALVATSGASSVPLSQSMLLHTRFGWAMGAAHELLVWAKAGTATTITLSMEQLGNPGNWKAERVHQVPGDGVLRPYRLNLTLPRDTAISQMRVSLGGPNLTIQGEPLLAAI